MDPIDRMEEFKRVSQFMRDTLKEVDDALGVVPQYTYEVCAHCLEPTVCTVKDGRVQVCVICKSQAVDGWLIVIE